MKKALIHSALVAFALGTVSCTGPYLELLATHGWTVDGDFARARAAHAPEGSFNEHLRVKYLAMAEVERAEFDWMDAANFARQAESAGNGRTVLPALPAGDVFMLPSSTLPDLNDARSRLLAVLETGGRERFADLASTAQVMYDCWVQEQEENHQFDEISACRKGFEDAMAAMREPVKPVVHVEPPARDYMVFFDFDKSAIRTDATSILDKVLGARKNLSATTVSLVGHADRAGADKYNQALSERRAGAVKKWLVEHGLPAAAVSAAGKGESDPRVATPDGIREPENRRVEIHID